MKYLIAVSISTVTTAVITFFLACTFLSTPRGGYPAPTINTAELKAISEVIKNDARLSNETILSFTIINSNCVEIKVGHQQKPLRGSGKYYVIKKSPEGTWKIIKEGSWISDKGKKPTTPSTRPLRAERDGRC